VGPLEGPVRQAPEREEWPKPDRRRHGRRRVGARAGDEEGRLERGA
jgi:hypothetical protein